MNYQRMKRCISFLLVLVMIAGMLTSCATGEQGIQGEKGENGKTPTFKVESHILYVSYDDGTNWVSLGNIGGTDGTNGTDGKDGANGKDGADGKDGMNGATPKLQINPTTNEWEVSYDEGETWSSLEIKANNTKQSYCQYDPTIRFENSVGGLRIYVPTYEGYINYNIVHTKSESDNKDIWRIGQAYACDDELKNSYAITPAGAEWDMALFLKGRLDFIGGHAHGDEIYTSIAMFLNGKTVEITSIEKLTAFDEIIILETSIGYDPNDHATQALKHYKEYIINADGITLNQKVEFLNDYTLSSSYMAMMPPYKTLTDSFYTNADYNILSTDGNFDFVPGATKAVVYGSSSNLKFTMSIPKYPSLPGGDKFYMTDNGGGSYNKIYFVVCSGADVKAGDIWETTTIYNITHG